MAEKVTKKGKIKSVTAMTYNGEHKQDKKGNYKHVVEMEDGAKGICGTKDTQASSWPVGTEVDYAVYTWTSEDGTQSQDYFSLVKTDSPYKGRSFGAAPKGEKEYKAEAVLVASKNAAQSIAINEKLTEKDYPSYFKAFLVPMYAEIEKIFK